MAASGTITRLGPLLIGLPARRDSELLAVTEKKGLGTARFCQVAPRHRAGGLGHSRGAADDRLLRGGRSGLYGPLLATTVAGEASREIEKAFTGGADAVIVDLEDAVAPSMKGRARAVARAWLSSLGEGKLGVGEIWVGVNPGPMSDGGHPNGRNELFLRLGALGVTRGRGPQVPRRGRSAHGRGHQCLATLFHARYSSRRPRPAQRRPYAC
jgi:HpcH/HpaI aldolase/citrate lyase family